MTNDLERLGWNVGGQYEIDFWQTIRRWGLSHYTEPPKMSGYSALGSVDAIRYGLRIVAGAHSLDVLIGGGA